MLELLHTDSLDAIVDKASRVLGNPIALLDSTYHILAHSADSVPDEAWNRAMRNRMWNYELVAKVNSLLKISETGMLRKPVILDDLGTHRRRVAGLTINKVLLGYFVVLEIDTPIGDVEEGSYELTAKVLTKALAINRAVSLQTKPGNTTVFLMDLLSGGFTDPLLFKERLKGCKLAHLSTFQVIAISLTGYIPGDLHEDRLKNGIQGIFPLSWSVPENTNIIVLLDYESIKDQEEALHASLTAFLEENNLVAGYSVPFADLYFMPEHRNRALRAMDLSRKFADKPMYPGKNALAAYEDYTLPDMVSRLPADTLPYFCNSKIHAMYMHDKAHETEYVHTLFHYINAGKSINKASVGLFIHHNTVYYRINKIKELFSIDFDNEFKNMQYYISCIILLFFWKRQP